MQDSTNAYAFTNNPEEAELLAGYIDGNPDWRSFLNLVHTHPAQRHVSITVTGNLSATVADQERGDLTPESAARWAKGEHGAGRVGTIYTSLDSWPACKDAVHAEGLDPDSIHDVMWWIAHWDGTEEPHGNVVAVQYAHDVHGVDLSRVADYWPGVDPVPTEEPTTEPTHVPASGPQQATTEAIVPNLSTLRHGDKGHAVRVAQGLLVAAYRDLGNTGHHGDGIDGDFGDLTQTAVREVQSDNGIAVDGVIGHDTWTALLTGKP